MNLVGLDGKNLQNISKKKSQRNIKGSLAAIGASSIATAASSLVNLLPIQFMVGTNKHLNKDEVQFVNKSADDILEHVTNLAKKNVTIENYTIANNHTNIPDFLYSLKDTFFAIGSGRNACFTEHDVLVGDRIPWDIIQGNTVIINQEKFPLAVFHELGHAFNYNNSAFWKNMQSLRIPGMVLASLFMLLPAITKDSKAQDGKELTKGQKFKNGLRKMSPALAFASMLPTLSEEAMASIRGCKWAKQLLDPSMYKKVLKTNVVAYSTYVIGALSFALGAFVAKKIKDKTQEKLETQNQSSSL